MFELYEGNISMVQEQILLDKNKEFQVKFLQFVDL